MIPSHTLSGPRPCSRNYMFHSIPVKSGRNKSKMNYSSFKTRGGVSSQNLILKTEELPSKQVQVGVNQSPSSYFTLRQLLQVKLLV